MRNKFLVFLILNFSALALGNLFTSQGVNSDWYSALNKAPWTPPGWAFGVAWTTIMICFTFYMTNAWDKISNHTLLIGLFSFQWFLNVLWTPVFFSLQNVLMGLIVISILTLLVGFFLFGFWSKLKGKALFVLPYFLWLLIATSLNAYILFNN